MQPILTILVATILPMTGFKKVATLIVLVFKCETISLRQYFRHIGFILAIKVLAITTIHHFFFSKEHRQKITPERVCEKFIGSY